MLYEIERLTSNEKQASTITEARRVLSKIQRDLLKTEDPPRPEYPFNQMFQQIVQQKMQSGQPLSPEEQRKITEYEQKEKDFNQGPLLAYNNKIKVKLNNSLNSLQSNSFLKKLSEQ